VLERKGGDIGERGRQKGEMGREGERERKRESRRKRI
jgi:hypothetical protein